MPIIVQIRNGQRQAAALPPISRQLANALGAGVRLAKAGLQGQRLTVPPEVEAARRALCEACPHFRPTDARCAACGCGTRGRLLNKLQYAPERCPLNPPKWERWRSAAAPLPTSGSPLAAPITKG